MFPRLLSFPKWIWLTAGDVNELISNGYYVWFPKVLAYASQTSVVASCFTCASLSRLSAGIGCIGDSSILISSFGPESVSTTLDITTVFLFLELTTF